MGAIVDSEPVKPLLEALETSDINPQGVELKAQLRDVEKMAAQRLRQEDNEIARLKEELTVATRHNSESLNDIVYYTADASKAEGQLRAGRMEMTTDDTLRLQEEKIERTRLAQLANMQAREIQSLRTEIEALSMKGGHVAPPAKAPPVGAKPAAKPAAGSDVGRETITVRVRKGDALSAGVKEDTPFVSREQVESKLAGAGVPISRTSADMGHLEV